MGDGERAGRESWVEAGRGRGQVNRQGKWRRDREGPGEEVRVGWGMAGLIRVGMAEVEGSGIRGRAGRRREEWQESRAGVEAEVSWGRAGAVRVRVMVRVEAGEGGRQ